MQLHISPHITDGELPVSMNPGSGEPFGVIRFGDAMLSDLSDKDCDRIIRAASRIKAMRATLGTPHQHEDGAGPHGMNCTACGMLPDWDDHADTGKADS